jgi:hypothetical protein
MLAKIKFLILKMKKVQSDPEVDPDPLDRGKDPGIRIRTLIPNTGTD